MPISMIGSGRSSSPLPSVGFEIGGTPVVLVRFRRRRFENEYTIPTPIPFALRFVITSFYQSVGPLLNRSFCGRDRRNRGRTGSRTGYASFHRRKSASSQYELDRTHAFLHGYALDGQVADPVLLEHQLHHAIDAEHRIPGHSRAHAIFLEQRLVRPQEEHDAFAHPRHVIEEALVVHHHRGVRGVLGDVREV
ncbi:MAG: hypothetical protein ABI867_37880, partial [Kofleriaceae bacterium]